MKTWPSSTSSAPASPNSEIILKLCPPQFFSSYCHSLRLFFKRRQEQTSLTMCKQQNLQLDYSLNILLTQDCNILLHLCTLLREAALAATEKVFKSLSHPDNTSLLFPNVLNTWDRPDDSKVNQNKLRACHRCKAYHGKIDVAVLCLARMANFGNVSSRVYLKQQIALSGLQTCRLIASSPLIWRQGTVSQ